MKKKSVRRFRSSSARDKRGVKHFSQAELERMTFEEFGPEQTKAELTISQEE
jgi:hypothetical protein